MIYLITYGLRTCPDMDDNIGYSTSLKEATTFVLKKNKEKTDSSYEYFFSTIPKVKND